MDNSTLRGVSVRIELPLPPKELSPNARVHWRAKAEATKRYRTLAWGEAYTAAFEVRAVLPWTHAETRAIFYFPDKRSRDLDNAAAALKAAWDGIADAGVIANDSGLVHHPPEMRVDKARPRVELTVQEAA